MKFFPAEVNGGVPALKALAGPYGSMRFVPTGGIGPPNLTSYLSQPNVLACGGSWLAPKDLVAQGRFDEIREICRRSSYAMHGFELAHVGINCDDAAEAKEVATSFATLFGLPVHDKGGGCFASDMVDVVKGRLLGERGHIGVSCVDVDRAKAWFERRGYRFVEKGVNRDERGYTSVFLEGEVGGFAVRLRRR